MTKSGWCFVPSLVIIRSPVLKALSLSHFLFTESTIKDWEIVLIAAATIVFFLLVAIGVLAVSIQIISLHFCDAYLNHNWQFVTHSKSNDWELYCRVIYTGEVRERQKVFEREVVGKNWTFNSFLGHENFFHHDGLVVGTWWCTAWLRHISIMSTTENYHAGLSLQRHLGTGGVVSCLRVARAFFSLTLLYLNRWNTETLNRVKGRNCMPLMENGN